MTLFGLYCEGKRILFESGIEEYEYDARTLLLFSFDISFTDYIMKQNEEADTVKSEGFLNLVKRRACHVPLQKLTGKAGFFGREFTCFEDVLIPRYDTEILLKAAIDIFDSFPEGFNNKILDLCSGSGCIGITLKLERQEADVYLSDISDAAINASKNNAEAHGVQVTVIKSDLFNDINLRFGLIVSNPPYITEEELNTLMPEVKEHEPYIALYGGNDGLYFYRAITREAVRRLEKGGFLAFEIGCTQEEAVKQLMKEAGFSELEVFKDFSGLPRVIQGKYDA